MRRRWPWAVGILAGLALLGLWVALLVNPAEEQVQGLEEAGDRPFGEGTTLPGDVLDAQYSPNGRHLLVRTDEGLALAQGGKLVPLGPRTPAIAAAAWYPTSGLVVVAEGPGRTGQLAVLDLDGEDAGVVALDPVVGFGSGHGIAVVGRRAVAVTVDRDPLSGAELRSLHVIDLATGKVRQLLGPDSGVSGSVFATATGDAVVTRTRGSEACAAVVDLDDGEVTCRVRGRAVGVAAGHVYAVHRGAVWVAALDGGEDAELTGAVEGGEDVVVAVAPDGSGIVVRDGAGLRTRAIPDPPVTSSP